jgi:hypothetical protein
MTDALIDTQDEFTGRAFPSDATIDRASLKKEMEVGMTETAIQIPMHCLCD